MQLSLTILLASVSRGPCFLSRWLSVSRTRGSGTRQTALDAALSRCRGAVFAVAVFSFAINALLLVVPLHMLHVYDHVLPTRSGSTLFFLSLLATVLLMVLAILELVRSRVLTRIGARLDTELGEPVFAAATADRL